VAAEPNFHFYAVTPLPFGRDGANKQTGQPLTSLDVCAQAGARCRAAQLAARAAHAAALTGGLGGSASPAPGQEWISWLGTEMPVSAGECRALSHPPSTHQHTCTDSPHPPLPLSVPGCSHSPFLLHLFAAPLQLFTFLLAGYETTSLALSYALYLLAQHPQHQQRIMEASVELIFPAFVCPRGAGRRRRGPGGGATLHSKTLHGVVLGLLEAGATPLPTLVPCVPVLPREQEVDALGGAEPAYEDLAGLQYTEAALQEAMRLYPPVSSFLALVSSTCAAALRDRCCGVAAQRGAGSGAVLWRGRAGELACAARLACRLSDVTRLFVAFLQAREPRSGGVDLLLGDGSKTSLPGESSLSGPAARSS
jgi:hypothetical protein